MMYSVIHNGLRIDCLEEYDYSPYDCFRKINSQTKTE